MHEPHSSETENLRYEFYEELHTFNEQASLHKASPSR